MALRPKKLSSKFKQKIKPIKRRGREDSKTRSSLKKRASKTRIGDDVPTEREGIDGEISIRRVEGAIKLYAKFRRKWYSIELE